MTVRPAKTQISLGIRTVWWESSICAEWVAKDPSFLHAHSEDSDQAGRMPRLCWVFAGRTFAGFVMRLLKYASQNLHTNMYPDVHMKWYDMIWYDMIWYDMIWYDMIWYDMIYLEKVLIVINWSKLAPYRTEVAIGSMVSRLSTF